MDSRGRMSNNSSHSSDQFNLYGAARERTHYQRANAFISNAFSFLGSDNHDAYKYYDDDGDAPILGRQQPYPGPHNGHSQETYPRQQYPQQPYPQHQYPQQPYPKRMSESFQGTIRRPDNNEGMNGTTCCLIAVIVFLVMAIIGVILGVVFGVVLKDPEHQFTSTIDTNEPWDAKLSNKASEEYLNMTDKMRNALDKAFDLSPLSDYSKVKHEILGFTQTSSSRRRRKRADATALCTVRTTFSSKDTPSVDKYMDDLNKAFISLKTSNKIDFEPTVLAVKSSTSTANQETPTTTEATTLVSRGVPTRATPAPVTCLPAASAGVSEACSAHTGDIGFPNLFGHKSVSQAAEHFKLLKALADTECMAEVEKFYCTLLYMPCVDSVVRPPCRKFCEDFVTNCKYPLSCGILPDSDDPDFCVTSEAQLAVEEDPPPYDFSCPSGKEICGIEPNCFATSKKCDGTEDCPDGSDELDCDSLVTFSCDFESNFCSFVQNNTINHFQWTRRTGRSPSPFTGPFIDHSKRTNAGKYMLAEASGRHPLDESVVWMPSQDIAADSCLQFYYHMRGIDVGGLEVHLDKDNTITTPWFQTRDHGDYWLLGRVPLTAGTVKVGFRAIMTGGYRGDIAIDDITIKKEACKPWNCETDEKRVKLFSCGNTNCVKETFLCDGKDDCGNYNDERNCVCSSSQFRCGIGMCIESRRQCDGVIDCPDRADEIGCKCPQGQIQCSDNSTCIMREWQCDRQVDCPGGEDEQYCRFCQSIQWQCRDFGCISRNNRCDGTPQCVDKSDEENCVQLTAQGTVMVTSQLASYHVCQTSYSDALGDELCQELGFSQRLSSSAVAKTQAQYVHIAEGEGSIVSRAVVNTSCDDQKVIQLSCESKECGKSFRNAAAVTYIINGNDAAGGRWPWQVAVFENNQFMCGGVIINSRQVLTAAHCITSELSARVYKVMAGSPTLQGTDPNRVYKQVKSATVHADFDNRFWFKGKDIAVFTIEGFFTFNNFIQPICLPDSSDTFFTSSTCYSAGWGLTDLNPKTVPNNLKEAKMKIVSNEECQASYSFEDKTICAGYDSGYIANCQGDSGGPLMCLGSDNRWKLAGIFVIAPTGCAVAEQPLVFSDVVKYLPWVNSVIECEHECENNQCVYTRDLCDGVDDCGDNSDEGSICADPANQGTSCTFENSYNCGYKSYGKNDYKTLERKKGPVSDNIGPSADKTLGSSAGIYIYASTGPAIFMGPPYSSTVAQCLTFYYLMRGTSSSLKVFRHPLPSDTDITGVTIVENQKATILTIAATSATGTWQLAKVDLEAISSEVPSGVLAFEFTGAEPKIAIDDVKVHAGACSAFSCEGTQFQCTDKSDCLPESFSCNFAKNCADGSDEAVANCPAESEADKIYRCNFEDLNLCSIRQQTDEVADWKPVPSAESVTTTGIPNSGPPGHYFYTNTSATPATDTLSASFSIDLEFRALESNTELCMQFLYWATTKGFLDITTVDSNNAETVTRLHSSHRKQWTNRRIHLSYNVKKIFFKAYTTAAVQPESRNFDFIAIDDIVISHGSCGCGDDEQFCADDIHCFKSENLCMGQAECPDGSDHPLNCTCDDSMNQFVCDNGKCIPENRQCNTNDDCGDESDERNCTRCNTNGNDNFLCSDGYCLKKSFKCDGAKDCSNDEEGCCPDDEFHCSTKTLTCLEMSKVCDGQSDCDDGSDELRCARLGEIGDEKNLLQIREGNEWHLVCAVGWNSNLDDSVCKVLNLGSDTASSSTATLPAGQSYYSKTGTDTTFKPHQFAAASSCTTNEAVTMVCSDSGLPCGFRDPEELAPVAYIVGGTLTTEGDWPWVGYIANGGKYQCAGALVNDQWFLTAAHCMVDTSPSRHNVVLGTTTLTASSQYAINAEVELIVKHPDFAVGAENAVYTQNDIVLVKLKSKVPFSLSVNRICLPEDSDTFATSDHCYMAGWGFSNPSTAVPVEDMRQLRTEIVADDDCKATGSDAVVHDEDRQLCAGYRESVSGSSPSICRGDSGGPLMCRKSGLWKVAGIVSWGITGCTLDQPTVFTKVSYYKTWIDTTISENSN